MTRTVLALAALAALAACNDKKAPPAPALTRDVIENGPVAERVPELTTLPGLGINMIEIDRWNEASWTPAGCAHAQTIHAMLDDVERTAISGTITSEGPDQTLAFRITSDDHFTLELRGPISFDAAMAAQAGMITGEAGTVTFTQGIKTCTASDVRIDLLR